MTAKDLGLARFTLAAGDSIGLDLSVNVSYPNASTSGPSGHRLGEYFLQGGAASPENDVRAFCTPKLLAP